MIVDKVVWQKWVDDNPDPYGKCAVDVARKAMEILDAEEDFDVHELLSRADREIDSGGLTGFLAGCAAQAIAQVHSRGEEFRRKWNENYQIGNEGDKANESGGVLNPALLNVACTDE